MNKSQTYFEKKNKVGGLHPSELKSYLKAILKRVWDYPKVSHKDQQNRTEIEKQTQIYFQHWCHDHSVGERLVFLTNGAETTGYPYVRRVYRP